MKAKDFMTKDVFTVKPESSIEEVLNILLANQFSGLPVVDDEYRVVGVITENDLINEKRMPVSPFIIYTDDHIHNQEMIKQIKEGLKVLNVSDLMVASVITVNADTHIQDIAGLLVEKGIKRVPVIDKDEKLIGIITRQDILKAVKSIFENTQFTEKE